MKKDKLIELARKVGFVIEVSTDPNSPPSWHGQAHNDKFEAFAAALTEPLKEIIKARNKQYATAVDDITRLENYIAKLEATANLTVSLEVMAWANEQGYIISDHVHTDLGYVQPWNAEMYNIPLGRIVPKVPLTVDQINELRIKAVGINVPNIVGYTRLIEQFHGIEDKV